MKKKILGASLAASVLGLGIALFNPESHSQSEDPITCANAKSEIHRLSDVAHRNKAENARLLLAIKRISGCWAMR